MELFAVWTDVSGQVEADRFCQCIKEKIKGLHISKRGFRLSFKHKDGRAVWMCRGNENHEHFQEWLPRISDLLSLGIADFIMETYERSIVEDMIAKTCSVMDEHEVEKVHRICMPLLLNGDLDQPGLRERRRETLAKSLRQDLEEVHFFPLEGLMNFRIRSYRQELQELVEYALDEFWMDRQYEEFMGLLKYFVFFQETKVPLIHLIHKDKHEFQVLDAGLNLLPVKKEEQVVVEMPGIELEMDIEDMIVSTLISISPEKVMLHTSTPELPIISTICQIFEDKVEICHQCPECEVLRSGLLTGLDASDLGNYNNC
ncbi:putative sporulation protein YtxC [Paenibacillus barcinonensis]|uniref:Sporulation protein YtxC n=1 Tax=Paenibacillus barcinonensis TaxID=198119 RepID=A0A2V4VFL7_PAEBA|nr:putative sporulation protein YtxC [Paenibacillus barcinonensis]PYE52640.1 putative sporulation protein YtxC [Paenibacillus barcinonensis]QKS59214.1 putative sporulation protein YtxC [Paenibacillus barcinonensis]